MIDLTIGVVTYNGLSLLRDCLDSIRVAGIGCDYEILVVDNGSGDGTPEWLRSQHPDVRVVVNSANRGVAAGNNQCFEHGRGRYVLLLNNDALVLPGMVDRLVALADDHPRAGAVGGRRVNADGSFQVSHMAFPTLRSEIVFATRAWALYDRTYPTRGDPEVTGLVEWMPSACLLVRTEAARAVGGVDETYFMYSDETDFQYRLHQAGYEVHYLADVSTVHLGGGSASHWRRRRMIYRGKLLFFRKHYGVTRTLALRAVFSLTSLAKMAIWTALRPIGAWRRRSVDELRSNWSIIRLALSREVPL